jgi:hypothetical protein
VKIENKHLFIFLLFSYLGNSLLNNINLYNDKGNSIGFNITPDLKIKYLDFIYYFNGTNIICEYFFNNNTYIFSFISNTINDIIKVVTYFNDNKIILNNKLNKINLEILKLLINKDDIKLFITNIKSLNIIFNNNYIFEGFLICLLFGLKRFGDWIQMEAAKKYYFLIQSCDFYANLYGILIGAPIILKTHIYNYLPNIDIKLKDDEFKIFNKDEIKLPISENSKIIYKSLRDIHTPNINRYYFNKYIKYKNKYLLFKKILID